MARIVLFLLAALAASVGYVIGQPWLFAAAGALVLVAIGLWVRARWQERRREKRKDAARVQKSNGPDDELRALGISDIRPRQQGSEALEEEAASPQEAAAPSEASPESPPKEAARADAAASDELGPDTWPQERAARAEDADATSASTAHSPTESPEDASSLQKQPSDDSASPSSTDADAPPDPNEDEREDPDDTASNEPADRPPEAEPVRAEEPTAATSGGGAGGAASEALLHALRLATGARTACLLAQEEVALDYRLEAADAAAEGLPLRETGSTFTTGQALLSAHAARRAVTLQRVGEDGLAPRHLQYYRQPPEEADAAPEVVVLVPLPLPNDDPTSRFLLLDGAAESLRGQDRLLERFAGLFADLLAADGQPASTHAPPAEPGASTNGQAAAEAERKKEGPPRPRNEIVAEEMARAREEERPLALALVYLNRAEAVAARGSEEVEAAERALRARLRQAAPRDGSRVEPFGELTYGVFLMEDSSGAERWAVALGEEMDEASDPLEGGVSVGLALMRGPDQPPESLRKNATSALREAYTTGTCTILE